MTKPPKTGRPAIQRGSGVALWRQIADDIRAGIASGLADADGRLMTEAALAARFGVNRHTVRAAIASLQREGVLEAQQGRGTFVRRRARYAFPIGARTRFSAGLEGQAGRRTHVLVASAAEAAGPDVAAALHLAEGAPVMRLETRGDGDGMPLSRATSWFVAELLPGLEGAFGRLSSITAAFAEQGAPDSFRASTVVAARHADAADLADLRLSPGAVVLVATAVNVDRDGKPIQFSVTRFAADRVELMVSGQSDAG